MPEIAREITPIRPSPGRAAPERDQTGKTTGKTLEMLAGF
jgi:hypothetical protein